MFLLQSPLHEVEPTSTSPNGCGNKKKIDVFISGYVALGNVSCNLCRNKIARQVARKTAQCNSALTANGNEALNAISQWNSTKM